jgi:hypothetical protein
MTAQNHFNYFIKIISELDQSFTYRSKDDYETLKNYIDTINQFDLIQHTITDLHIQDKESSQHVILDQPLSKLLDESFLSQYLNDSSGEVHFMMVFSENSSDYSSHVKIVGMLSPQFTYQVIVKRLNPFEESLLFTLQLALYTMWEASQKGTYPWIILTDY